MRDRVIRAIRCTLNPAVTNRTRLQGSFAFRKGQTEMIPLRKRNAIRQRVHTRIRRRMVGTAERPRLNIYRSLNHIYAQVIDDAQGVTVVSASAGGSQAQTG